MEIAQWVGLAFAWPIGVALGCYIVTKFDL